MLACCRHTRNVIPWMRIQTSHLCLCVCVLNAQVGAACVAFSHTEFIRTLMCVCKTALHVCVCNDLWGWRVDGAVWLSVVAVRCPEILWMSCCSLQKERKSTSQCAQDKNRRIRKETEIESRRRLVLYVLWIHNNRWHTHLCELKPEYRSVPVCLYGVDCSIRTCFLKKTQHTGHSQ